MKNFTTILFISAFSIILLILYTIVSNELPPPSPSIIEGEGFCGFSTYGRCTKNDDCIKDGCSGQVCRSIYEERIITTCEWRECYDASKYGLSCRCVNRVCAWA